MFISNQIKSYIRITIFITITNVLLLLLITEKYKLIGVVSTLIVAEILFIILYFYNSFLKIKKQI